MPVLYQCACKNSRILGVFMHTTRTPAVAGNSSCHNGSGDRTRTDNLPVTPDPSVSKRDGLYHHPRGVRGASDLSTLLHKRIVSEPSPTTGAWLRITLLLQARASRNSPRYSSSIARGSCTAPAWISLWQFAHTSMHLSASFLTRSHDRVSPRDASPKSFLPRM